MARIVDVETFLVDVPIERRFEQLDAVPARTTEVIVRVHADDGTVGIGTGAALHTVRGAVDDSPLRPVARMVVDHLAPAVVGADPIRTEDVWQRMFALTMDKGSPLNCRAGTQYPKGLERPHIMAAIAAVDIAVWDLVGKLLAQPLWRLLGGARDAIATYTTGGYYGPDIDDAALAAEFAGYVEAGFRAVKLKAGGRPPAVDVERVRVVREAVGGEVELFVDGHRGYTIPQAIEAGHGMESLDVAWYEEPAPWYDDIEGLGRIVRGVRLPVCAGESEHTAAMAIALIERAGIHVCNFDATKAGGITEARRVAAYAAHKGVDFAPHHAAHIHAHLAAAVPNGRIVEAHGDPTRDPLAGRLYRDDQRFEDGHLVLGEQPGLGSTLDDAVLAEVAVRVE